MAARQAAAKRARVRVRAYAKVNLDLRVLGTRSDGYHEVRTVFQSIALHDTLLCVTRPGPFALRCRNASVPLDESNLVWRAAAALWTAAGHPGPPTDVVISIKKAIPMEAGLGGGSADAAAALLALSRLWGGVPLPIVRDVASGIGADVPYFLSGGTALGLGRGEEIYPLVDLPTHWVVVVHTLHMAFRPPKPTPGTTRTGRPGFASRVSRKRCLCPGRPVRPR